MPHYLSRGSLPGKRHIQHRDDQGTLRFEELVSRQGFSDIYSNLYHLFPPTRIRRVGNLEKFREPLRDTKAHRPRHWRTNQLPIRGDWIRGRTYLASNPDVRLALIKPEPDQDSGFYRNGAADELIFVQEGTGVLESNFGSLTYGPGDYLIIPRGVIVRLAADKGAQTLLIMETRGPIRTPRRYRNEAGQLLEHAPFSERDLRVPNFQEPKSEQGEFEVLVRLDRGLQTYVYAQHPFDVVGWDGCYYPWAFHILDFMPIVGKIHQPPPVHQTFEAEGLVVCSFVPRLYDFHQDAIPAPYAHSNVDSDEILFYSSGNFMSRKGIGSGSITYHPMGLPHGPQPGRYEESIGKKGTNELAVMLDTFQPLLIHDAVTAIDDPDYSLSWMEEG